MCIFILYICTVQAGPHLLKYLNNKTLEYTNFHLFVIILFSTKQPAGISKFSHAGDECFVQSPFLIIFRKLLIFK